jgi:hypothetical protein
VRHNALKWVPFTSRPGRAATHEASIPGKTVHDEFPVELKGIHYLCSAPTAADSCSSRLQWRHCKPQNDQDKWFEEKASKESFQKRFYSTVHTKVVTSSIFVLQESKGDRTRQVIKSWRMLFLVLWHIRQLGWLGLKILLFEVLAVPEITDKDPSISFQNFQCSDTMERIPLLQKCSSWEVGWSSSTCSSDAFTFSRRWTSVNRKSLQVAVASATFKDNGWRM